MEPIHIIVAEGATHVNKFTCQRLSQELEAEAEEHLQELLHAGVIVKIGVKEAIIWCAPSIFVCKSSERVRLVTNVCGLNKSVSRVGWPFPSSEAMRKSVLPDSKILDLGCI